jgi:hypothetical protein
VQRPRRFKSIVWFDWNLFAILMIASMAIVFLSIDSCAVAIGFAMQSGSFACGHMSICLGVILVSIEAILTSFQAICFGLGKFTRIDSLLDALLLIRFTPIQFGRVGKCN